MKRATFILGLLFWVATFTSSSAQEKERPGIVQLPILLDCGPTETIAQMVIDYEEIPVAQAEVLWRVPSGEFLSGPMTIFAHPETRTISIVIQPTEEFACIVFPGNNFGPYAQGKKT